MAVPGIPTGVHVMLMQGERVLLMRRMNTGFFDGLFSLPGGHVEPGESVKMAAIREMREELAIELVADDLHLTGVVHRLSDTNRIDFFLHTSHWTGLPVRAEPDKCAALQWVARDALPVDTVPYVAAALARDASVPWIAESGWADRRVEI